MPLGTKAYLSALYMPAAHYLPYAATQRFSPLVLDYLKNTEALDGLYTYRPDAAGLAQALEARKQYPVNRAALVEVLNDQYQHLPVEHKAHDSIALLAD